MGAATLRLADLEVQNLPEQTPGADHDEQGDDDAGRGVEQPQAVHRYRAPDATTPSDTTVSAVM
jgi:hypothetical protein